MAAGSHTPAVPAWEAAPLDEWPEVAAAVVNQWPEPLYVLDRQAVVRHANAAGRRAAGDDPRGRPLSLALELDGVSAVRLAGAVASGVGDTLRALGHGDADLLVVVQPLHLGAQAEGAAVLVRRPATPDQGVAEEIRAQRMAALARLAAGTAHEIRNPLTAIRGFLQLLQAECPREPAGRYVDIVSQEIRRIEALTADLLLLSRAPVAPLTPCDLGPLLQDTCSLLAEIAGDRGARLELRVEPRLPPCLAVRERLQQVFLNLVGNAIEAMPHGGTVVVAVQAVRTGAQDHTEWVEVAVRDDGPGIPPEVMPRIFEPFFTTKAGGTGLGLAVSENIVYGLGGRILVESPPGRGATFIVRLPALTSGAAG
jgi:signal transduction histidine kinase